MSLSTCITSESKVNRPWDSVSHHISIEDVEKQPQIELFSADITRYP